MTDDGLREHLKDRKWRLENIYCTQDRETGEITPLKLSPCQRGVLKAIEEGRTALHPILRGLRLHHEIPRKFIDIMSIERKKPDA